ncbi:MAG: hypothetical protein JWM26_1055 [Betaproteobacteria bacterium]|jgi:hypothetical protein|nr:hypothetical protein [Betaproteobacteria bacterium]
MSSGPIGGKTGLKYFGSFLIEGNLTEAELKAAVDAIEAILNKPKTKGKLTAHARLNGTMSPPVTNVRIG